MALREPTWVEVDRWSVRRASTGKRVEVAFEKFGEGLRAPYRLRVVEIDAIGPGRNHEFLAEGDYGSLASTRERARRLLLLFGGRTLDCRSVVCDSSVEIPGVENVSWPGPCFDDNVRRGILPAIDRELAEMRRRREELERDGPFVAVPLNAAAKIREPRRQRSKS